MSPDELAAELRRVGLVAASLQARYQAHIALHRAACMTGTPAELEQRRDEVHTILDVLLDNEQDLQRLLLAAGMLG